MGRDLIQTNNDYQYLTSPTSLFDLLGLTKIEVTYDRVWKINKRGFRQMFYTAVVHIIEPPTDCCKINFIQVRKSSNMLDYIIDNIKNSNEPYYYPHIGVTESIYNQTNGNTVTFDDAPGGAIDATDFILYVVEVCREYPPDFGEFQDMVKQTPIIDRIKVLATARLSVGAGGEDQGCGYTPSADSNKALEDVLNSQEWKSPYWNRSTNVKLEN